MNSALVRLSRTSFPSRIVRMPHRRHHTFQRALTPAQMDSARHLAEIGHKSIEEATYIVRSYLWLMKTMVVIDDVMSFLSNSWIFIAIACAFYSFAQKNRSMQCDD